MPRLLFTLWSQLRRRPRVEHPEIPENTRQHRAGSRPGSWVMSPSPGTFEHISKAHEDRRIETSTLGAIQLWTHKGAHVPHPHVFRTHYKGSHGKELASSVHTCKRAASGEHDILWQIIWAIWPHTTCWNLCQLIYLCLYECGKQGVVKKKTRLASLLIHTYCITRSASRHVSRRKSIMREAQQASTCRLHCEYRESPDTADTKMCLAVSWCWDAQWEEQDGKGGTVGGVEVSITQTHTVNYKMFARK